MNLQYISDSNGNTTGIYIPISDWNLLKSKYKDIEELAEAVPDWHKNIVLKRLKDYRSDNEYMDFDTAMDEIDNGL